MSGWVLIESSAPINVDGCPAGSGALVPVALEGPPGPVGPPGPAGTAGPTYVHTQSVAALVWTVNHNLGFYPTVSVVDNLGNEVAAQVTHLNLNQAQILFNSSAVGTARFN